MNIDLLLTQMRESAEEPALIWHDETFTYGWLVEMERSWQTIFDREDVRPGEVAAIVGDYSPSVCALLLALIRRQAVVVPLTSSVASRHDTFMEVSEVQTVFRIGEGEDVTIEKRGQTPKHPLTRSLLDRRIPGLVLYSSGSTGESKAALHDLTKLLARAKSQRTAMRTLVFLLLDHIGGINTLFYILANKGVAVTIDNRTPDAVCQAIERHRVELLPTSPTFLNLLLLSQQHENYDLSTLKLITYGTEVMPETTLKRLTEQFPGVGLKQTYGLSELGILRSKSRDSGSLWVKVGGEGFETRIEDGTLWIRSETAMLGYLNSASPFDDDGWFNTHDRVEVDGDYVRFLGRDSDIINVGGEKVYPAEVESVLAEVDNVADACVYGERHPITGNIVVAEVVLGDAEPAAQVRKRIRKYCADRLARYKIPIKVILAKESRAGARFKKMRPLGPEAD
jgi:long-chain acyl-CoA synthetase